MHCSLDRFGYHICKFAWRNVFVNTPIHTFAFSCLLLKDMFLKLYNVVYMFASAMQLSCGLIFKVWLPQKAIAAVVAWFGSNPRKRHTSTWHPEMKHSAFQCRSWSSVCQWCPPWSCRGIQTCYSSWESSFFSSSFFYGLKTLVSLGLFIFSPVETNPGWGKSPGDLLYCSW